ncbi:hypothetical protein [Micromonospora haikouensis]|uniref:hypothetical protein n=1 Tax=Micromonospora haikouensis TaxID=686309 RepID=UPI000B08F2A6|nr:hypothetical protein [Micromonospora haikouensis]
MTALGLFHRTISEVEDAILRARARQAYRTLGEPAEERAAADLNRWPALREKA